MLNDEFYNLTDVINKLGIRYFPSSWSGNECKFDFLYIDVKTEDEFVIQTKKNIGIAIVDFAITKLDNSIQSKRSKAIDFICSTGLTSENPVKWLARVIQCHGTRDLTQENSLMLYFFSEDIQQFHSAIKVQFQENFNSFDRFIAVFNQVYKLVLDDKIECFYLDNITKLYNKIKCIPDDFSKSDFENITFKRKEFDNLRKTINGHSNVNNATHYEQLQSIKDGDENIFELIYTPHRELIVHFMQDDRKITLCNPRYNSTNDRLLKYIIDNPNKTLSRVELENTPCNDEDYQWNSNIGKSSLRTKPTVLKSNDKNFTRVLEDIKMTKKLKAVFFGKDFSPEQSIHLTNPVTKKNILESSTTFEELEAEILKKVE